jgi:hypothetical protein
VVNEAAGSESVEGRETCGRAKRRRQETRAERGGVRRPAPSAAEDAPGDMAIEIREMAGYT